MGDNHDREGKQLFFNDEPLSLEPLPSLSPRRDNSILSLKVGCEIEVWVWCKLSPGMKPGIEPGMNGVVRKLLITPWPPK